MRARKAAQTNRTVAGSYCPPIITNRHERARRRALRVSERRRTNEQQLPSVGNLRGTEGIRIALPEIHRANPSREDFRRSGEVDQAGAFRSLMAPVIAALGKVLFRRIRLPGRELADQIFEAFYGRRITTGIDAEGSFVAAELEALLNEDASFIDAAGHFMKRDAVLGLAIQNRPGRRVHPGVGRQRSVMEVDCRTLRESQHLI